MNWEQYRRPDRSINVAKAFEDTTLLSTIIPPYQAHIKALAYLRRVESLTPIRSTQAAAIVFTQAELINAG